MSSALDDLTCEVCCQEFDDSWFVPKILNCGHTFCIKCVEKCVNSNHFCPKCRQTLLSQNLATYQTNFSILSLALKAKQSSIDNKIFDVEGLQTKIQEHRNVTELKVKVYNDYLLALDHCFAQLEDMDNVKASNREATYLKEATFQKVIDDLTKAEEIILPLSLVVNPSMRAKQFANKNDFLDLIYQRVTQGEIIVSVHYFENRLKYGRVSVWSNAVLFHCLCLSECPEGASLILFDDLKECIHLQFRTFLQISCNDRDVRRMVFAEVAQSPLLPQFVKLCTGECGPCYKDRHFTKGEDSGSGVSSLLKVEMDFGDKLVDYNIQPETEVWYPKFTTTVHAWCDGSFQMLYNTSNNYHKNVVAKVETPSTDLREVISYKENFYLPMKDSGIAFFL